VNVSDPAAEASGELPAEQVDPAALYLTHRKVMSAAARQVLGTTYASEIDSAVGEVMATRTAMHRRGGLTPVENWAAYLKQAVRNAAMAIVTKRTQVTSLDETPHAGAQLPADIGADPIGDQLLIRVRSAAVHNAIDQLDDRRSQRIVIGRYFDGLTDRELGDELDLTGQRVGQIRRVAERKLAELLGGEQP